MKRDKSIIQKDMSRCYVCGCATGLETHEVFFGSADRQKSIKWHLYVRLCGHHHNKSNDGVHFNRELDLRLKKDGQKAFEALYGHEKFMQVFGKNYL